MLHDVPFDQYPDPEAYARHKRRRSFFSSWGLILLAVAALLLVLPLVLRRYIRAVAESSAAPRTARPAR